MHFDALQYSFDIPLFFIFYLFIFSTAYDIDLSLATTITFLLQNIFFFLILF